MQISRTALSMALFRALETANDPNTRLFSDPFAAKCLPWPLRPLALLAGIRPLGDLICLLLDWRYPGARTSGIARTRLIDDWLAAEIQKGGEQLLILGAGFDARPLRLEDCRKMPTFEVDQASIIEARDRLFSHSTGSSSTKPSANRRSVTLNFLTDSLSEKLLAAGFDQNKKTIVLWEGVTNYLDSVSVSKTLATLSTVCPADSVLIFTYIDEGVLKQPDVGGNISRLNERLASWGESWTFGIDPQAASCFLQEFDFSLQVDLSASQYRRCVFGEKSCRHSGYEFYHLARCTVVSKPQRVEINATG